MEKSCHQSAWRNAWKTQKATGPQSKYWMLPSLMQQVSCLFTVSSLGSPTAPTPIWHWYPITSKISWDQGHTKTSCRSCIGIQYDSFRTALIVWSVKDSGRIWTASHLAGVVNWNPLRLLQGSGRCCGNSHLLVVSSWNRPSFQVPDPVCIWNIRFDDWMVAIKAVQPSRQGKDPVIGFQGHHRVKGLEAPSAGECASTEDYGWIGTAMAYHFLPRCHLAWRKRWTGLQEHHLLSPVHLFLYFTNGILACVISRVSSIPPNCRTGYHLLRRRSGSCIPVPPLPLLQVASCPVGGPWLSASSIPCYVTAEKGCRPSWTRIFTMKLHGSTESEMASPTASGPSQFVFWSITVDFWTTAEWNPVKVHTLKDTSQQWSKKCWVSLLRKCSKTLSLLKLSRHNIFEHFQLNTPRSFLLHHTNNKARPGRRHFGAVVAYTGGGSPANPPTQTWETSLSKQVSQVWVGGLKGDPPPV